MIWWRSPRRWVRLSGKEVFATGKMSSKALSDLGAFTVVRCARRSPFEEELAGGAGPEQGGREDSGRIQAGFSTVRLGAGLPGSRPTTRPSETRSPRAVQGVVWRDFLCRPRSSIKVLWKSLCHERVSAAGAAEVVSRVPELGRQSAKRHCDAHPAHRVGGLATPVSGLVTCPHCGAEVQLGALGDHDVWEGVSGAKAKAATGAENDSFSGHETIEGLKDELEEKQEGA